MCGDEGNLIAEGFGVLLIVGRYLWVAQQARRAVLVAEATTADAAAVPADAGAPAGVELTSVS